MRNIRNREEAVMEALKSINIVGQDKQAHRVPALYADYDKLKSFAMITTKADGVIELKNQKLKLPALSVIATAITRNSIEFEGHILTATRQDLNQIVEKMYCLEVEDSLGNNDLTIHRTEISTDDTVPAIHAKFTATLNM